MRKRGIGFNFLIVMISLLSTLMVAGTASAKSLYVIGNINTSPTPIQTYDIQGGTPDYLVFQAEQGVPNLAGGAVGIAIDTDSIPPKLFTTYEFSGTIQLLDATTFADLGTTTAPGASNLSGIVVDQGKSRVYTVDRNSNELYVYDWDSSTDTLTIVPGGTGPGGSFLLAGVTNAFGIAFDESRDRLYIADGSSNTVRWFETTNFTESGSIVLATHRPISIAIDQVRNFLYTGARFNGDYNLVKYDLNTGTEKLPPVSIPSTTGGVASEGVIGVAVDEDTGNVYATTGYSGDRLMTFDSDLNELEFFTRAEIQAFGTGTNWGDPTGLVVPRAGISFNPLNFSKVSRTGGTGEVGTGEDLTYDLCYDNTLNPTTAVNNVVITDAIPTGATFVSATGGTLAAGTVTWNIGNLAAGAPQACVQLVLNITAAEGDTVTNIATIDSDDTPPTSQTDVVDVVASTGTVVVINGTGGGSATGPLEIVLLMSGLGTLLARRRRAMRKYNKAAMGALVVAGAAMATSPVVNAASPYYVGVSGGISQADYSATDLVNALPAYTLSNVNVDDSDVGWKVFGGWQFHPNFAVEAAYVDLGEIKTSFGATVPDVPQLLADTAAIHPYMASGFTLAGVGSYNFNPNVSVMGKVGLFNWDAEVDITEVNSGQKARVDQSGTDLMFGLGAKYLVTPQWGVRAEWESYDLDWDRVDFFSLGAELRF